MNTTQIIKEFRGYQKENPSAIQSLIKADNVARQYYEGISEATEGFTDFDEEIIEASEFNKVMERFNAKLKATLTTKAKKSTKVAKKLGKKDLKLSKAKTRKVKPRVFNKKEEKPKQEKKAKATPRKTKANPETKTKKVELDKNVVRTHIETPEHKQISRFLAIRSKETLQLAMTAYKSLQKDITERKIRKTSEQAALIQAIQKSYYAYLTRETTSLVLGEKWLKEAKEFVGSQKPFESVALVKRFIGWGGKAVKEKQLADFTKDAEKALKSGKESDPYADELKAILLKIKKAKAGDSLLADAVGLSGLTKNTIKVQK